MEIYQLLPMGAVNVPLNPIEFQDIEVDGVEEWDYPDFCDAFISDATAVLADGSVRAATEEELEELSDNRDLVYRMVEYWLY